MITSVSYQDKLTNIFPELHVCCLLISNINTMVDVAHITKRNILFARNALEKYKTESSFPSISLWRSAYRKVGIEPTKFRMASESLLRRLRKQGDLPETLHPLVLICNSLSVKYCLPIAALDADKINGHIKVMFTNGNERYTSLSGEELAMPINEVSFVDENLIAHARKWSHKQSAVSVISGKTTHAIVFLESLMPFNCEELSPLISEIIDDFSSCWPESKIQYQIKSTPDLSRFF